jgi:hypothetical protein
MGSGSLLFLFVVLNLKDVSTYSRVTETLVKAVIEANFSSLAGCIGLARVSFKEAWILVHI